ncbi:MAG: prolyl oligopeptidase family serine peptidase [Maricaulaceae bacterium]|jgi:dipeptidyl aminopeptidase/acylaminoacyl peptidase
MLRNLRTFAASLLAAGLCACGEPNERAEDRAAPAPVDAAAAEALLANANPKISNRLIPRTVLFGDPQRTRGRLSPDGANLAWLEPHGGVLNIWTAPVEHPDTARVLTAARAGGVTSFDWLRNNTHIIFTQRDEDGANQHVFTVNVITGEVVSLPPGGADTISRVAAVSWDYPDDVVIEANDRDPNYFDLHRINVITGAHEVIFENTEQFARIYLDNSFNVRFTEIDRLDGARQFFARLNGQWIPTTLIAAEDADATRILDFDLTNSAWFVLSARGRDSTALVRYDLAASSGPNERTIVAAVAGADISDVLFHPITYEADAVLVEGLTDDWLPLTARAVDAFADLDRQLAGDYEVLSRTIDDRLWVVLETDPANPGAYHLYDRETGEVQELTESRPALGRHRLAPMTPVIITARDGLELTSYLTLPAGADMDGDAAPERPSPLVIMPDPGPGSRARYEFNAIHQWLADRGYAALSVNVRGASGFGKDFQNAGDGELGAAVNDDLVDAAAWAVEQGVVEPGAIAAAGHWLGGYTALASVLEEDTPFACAVAYNSPFDFAGYVDNMPLIWSNIRSAIRRKLGDPSDVIDREIMQARSLIGRTPQFASPVLVIDGAPSSGAQAVASRPAMQAAYDAGVRATYVELPEDADGLAAARNRVAFYAVVEAFLSECLGGMMSPIEEDLELTTVRAPIGAEHIPALAEALSADSS